MYDLYQLGWFNFQQLCLTIARELLGQNVTSFLDSHDGGRDGAFTGSWEPKRGMRFKGKFVIQCKFTSRKGRYLKISDLEEEFTKVESLVAKGFCDVYILMTNAGVSGKKDEEITARLREIGVEHILVCGSSWITNAIKENANLRRLVPRLYGLGDLSQILDERVYRQGRALLEYLKEDLGKVVVTDTYRKAAHALSKHGFVLLVGEPAAGKTTIASLLAMAALDEWKASTLKLESAEKVFEHWNPDDPNQFFWVDDVFGITQYEQNLATEWNHYIPKIHPFLKSGARLVLTSRDYIYNRAKNQLKTGSFPLLEESQVVIKVKELTLLEKQQILYNHLKMGGQPKAFLKKIKPFLSAIAELESFTPESARRLAEPVFTRKLETTRQSLISFFDEQEDFLLDVFKGLDDDSLAGLALIYMNQGKLKSPMALTDSERDVLERMGSSLSGIVKALSHLEESLVRHESNEEESFWNFKHPTIGDAFAKKILGTPELMTIYLHGTNIEKMLGQVTCGEVGLENAFVIPAAYFDEVAAKLQAYKKARIYHHNSTPARAARNAKFQFLSRRCNAVFLKKYIASDDEVLKDVEAPGLYLTAVAEVDLAVRLFELGVFPENSRKKFLEAITEYTVSGSDLYGLASAEIRSIFTAEEWLSLQQRLLAELIPNLDEVTREWKSAWFSDLDPRSHFEDLQFCYEALKAIFKGNEEVELAVTRQIITIHEWFADGEFPEKDSEEDDEEFKSKGEDIFKTGRSVFDDIDE